MKTNHWQGDKVSLRAIEPEDHEKFYAWNKDTLTQQALDSVWFPSSKAGQKDFAEKEAKKETKNDKFNFVIETLDGVFVGTIDSHTTDSRIGWFKYGIAISKEHRGKGYASEAILLLLRYFFRERRYQKVNVDVFDYNASSLKLHKSLGFAEEGRIRRNVFTDGKHFDTCILGMTVEEFEERHGNRFAKTAIRLGELHGDGNA